MGPSPAWAVQTRVLSASYQVTQPLPRRLHLHGDAASCECLSEKSCRGAVLPSAWPLPKVANDCQ